MIGKVGIEIFAFPFVRKFFPFVIVVVCIHINILHLYFFNTKRNLFTAKNSAIIVIDNLVSAFDNSVNGGQPLFGLA